MGMKKSNALALMSFAMMMSATDNSYAISERGNVGSGQKPEPKKEPTPFSKQEGVLKMIKDYNLIREGKSRKGISKQARIKSKVEKWLEDGWLNKEHLKQ